MSTFKCETCGGNIIIKADTATGVCESCGNRVELDSETARKYQFLLSTADRKMMYNSVKSFTEAIEILEDIPFVDGTKEKIELCNKRIDEIRAEQESKAKQIQRSDSAGTGLGVVLIICAVLALILIAAGIGFVIFKLVKGELSTGSMYVLAAVFAVFFIVMIVGKIKEK